MAKKCLFLTLLDPPKPYWKYKDSGQEMAENGQKWPILTKMAIFDPFWTPILAKPMDRYIRGRPVILPLMTVIPVAVKVLEHLRDLRYR